MGRFIIEIIFGLVISSVVVWAVRRSRRASGRTHRNSSVIEYGIGTKAVAFLTSGFGAGLTFLMFRYGTNVPIWGYVFACVMTSGGLVWAANTLFGRFVVTREGLVRTTFFRPKIALRWDRVSYVGYPDLGNTVHVETFDGQSVDVSTWMTGLGSLAAALLDNVDSDRFDDEARVVLENARGGYLPDIDLHV